MATIGNFSRNFALGVSTLTTTLGSTATTGNCLWVWVRYRTSAASITSVVTTGGTGSDTFTIVSSAVINETSQYGGVQGFLLQSCGAGRTGVTVNLSANANPEMVVYEVSGISNPTVDVIYDPFPSGGTNTSAISGTTPSLSTSVEAAFVFGDDEDTFKTGSTPFTAGAWTWDATSPNTGSAYGSQVTAATTGLATTITQQSGSWQCEFIVATLMAGAANNPVGKLIEVTQAIRRASFW